MAINTGVQNTVIGRFISNMDAPYNWWVTIQCNLIKYSSSGTSEYLCCRSHVLFDQPFNSSAVAAARRVYNFCEGCVEQNSIPDFCAFEYFHLSPRIRSYVANEVSATELYGYLSRQGFVDDCERGDENTLHEIFDGQLYKDIVDECGGANAIKSDIFLGLSSDGFQTFAISLTTVGLRFVFCSTRNPASFF